jgi:hypothetical protein
MKLYALKSLKSRRYFQWQEYAEDGWGKYEDTVILLEGGVFDSYNLPCFFTRYQMFEAPKSGVPWCVLKDHDLKEVMVVEFELKFVAYHV